MPKMSRRLARIDPMREACTMRISFFANAMLSVC